jgi:hypothetical protein
MDENNSERDYHQSFKSNKKQVLPQTESIQSLCIGNRIGFVLRVFRRTDRDRYSVCVLSSER